VPQGKALPDACFPLHALYKVHILLLSKADTSFQALAPLSHCRIRCIFFQACQSALPPFPARCRLLRSAGQAKSVHPMRTAELLLYRLIHCNSIIRRLAFIRFSEREFFFYFILRHKVKIFVVIGKLYTAVLRQL